jgi:hypothetical protein
MTQAAVGVVPRIAALLIRSVSLVTRLAVTRGRRTYIYAEMDK